MKTIEKRKRLKLINELETFKGLLKEFPSGVLSLVSDTFNLWDVLTKILSYPEIKELILARDGKLVIRPDSGDPVDIVCGLYGTDKPAKSTSHDNANAAYKGVIELLWDTFGGTTNNFGFKVLDSHIGCIYGDSITPERQIQMYERLSNKQFACTNIVLGVGSFTYQYNTRDTAGYAAKASWFEIKENGIKKPFNIYKEPVTDSDKTKKSLKGLQCVLQDENGEYYVKSECTWEEEAQGLLHTIYEDGQFYNQTTLTQIRERLNKSI